MKAERWTEIEGLYHAALARREDERRAFLEQACAQDEALRREVESLLESDRRAEGFMEVPAFEQEANELAEEEAGETARRVGQSVGPYRILEKLGAGGMGVVYKAEDTRLGRMVALKFLSVAAMSSSPSRVGTPALQIDPATLERFKREARSISALSHPHICALYDLGEESGVPFLVMEYLEGQTLAERLSKGPLPFDRLLEYGIQIAEALSKAHRQGFIHRDLKPSNIMLTKSGVKLLDFGLAKHAPGRVGVGIAPLRSAGATQASGQEIATESNPLTVEGTLLGTLQYMAPEQLEGKDADARSDIFALGAVLYEMATGKKAFESKSQASLIAAILEKNPPPITALQPTAPPALERLVKKCLAKDPDDRWQSSTDLRDELKWIAEGDGGRPGNNHWPLETAQAAALKSGARPTLQRISWGLAGVCALVALAFAVAYYKRPIPNARAMRFSVYPPEKTTFDFGGFTAGPPTLSPDGRWLAFVARTAQGNDLLWLRPLDGLSARSLRGTEGAYFPFWSPDNASIGFFAGGKLKKVDLSRGVVETVCDAASGRGGTWNQEGVIVFAPMNSGPLYRVSAAGGVPETATRLDQSRHEDGHRWPWFLPDGHHFLYLSESGDEAGHIAVYLASLESKEARLLLPIDSNVAYSPDPDSDRSGRGYLIFRRESDLAAQAFDLKRLQTIGDASVIAENVEESGERFTSRSVFSVSQNGILAYQAATPSGRPELAWFDRSGKKISSVDDTVPHATPRISPDGRKIALSVFEPGETPQVWLYDFTRGLKTRFTFGSAVDILPLWSPDGSRIVFTSRREGRMNLYEKSTTGAGSEEPLFISNSDKFVEDWSRDGRFIAFINGDPTGKKKGEIWILPVDNSSLATSGGASVPRELGRLQTGKPFVFLATAGNLVNSQFSPDGHWIAYTSNESGHDEVYVAPFPVPTAKWQVSTAGGSHCRWSGDGKEIFYITPDSVLMVAEVGVQSSTFAVGAVHVLFRVHRAVGGAPEGPFYDVSRDGQRFLITSIAEENSAPVTVVVNWTADLKH